MSDKPIEIKLENKEVEQALLDLAKRTENLRPLMKNIAGVLASATEESFKQEGRPDKWLDLAESTKKQRNGLTSLILPKRKERKLKNGRDKFCKLQVSLLLQFLPNMTTILLLSALIYPMPQFIN